LEPFCTLVVFFIQSREVGKNILSRKVSLSTLSTLNILPCLLLLSFSFFFFLFFFFSFSCRRF
jgi:hypothetical protein